MKTAFKLSQLCCRHLQLIVVAALCLGLQPCLTKASPVTTHPRLWITSADLPRLRSWATSANPMYASATSKTLQEAISTYNTQFFPGGTANPTWPDEGLTGSGNAIVTESYAEFFAFNSLIDPDSSKRATYATYAYNLIMYAFNQIYSKMNTNDQNWGNSMMAIYDRARWQGEAFPLTVDWIYNKFTTADKVKIQKVFLYWDNAINTNYRSPIDHGLNGVGDVLRSHVMRPTTIIRGPLEILCFILFVLMLRTIRLLMRQKILFRSGEIR